MNEPYTYKVYTKSGITKGLIFEGKRVLHIGCGNSKLSGAIGLDRLSLPSVDIVHDLDQVPWPLEDSSIDIIFAHSVVEHLDSIVDFIDESWRILRPGGRIIMAVPYFRSVDSYTDPTHKHFFTSRSFDYFLNGKNSLSNYSYSKHSFKKIGFWYGWPVISNNPVVQAFKRYINYHARIYDQYLSLLLPMKILIWELEK